MKHKIIFVIAIVLLNIYYFVVWLVAFNKFATQLDRVNYFLAKSIFFNSVGTLNITLLIATIASLIILNIKPLNNQAIRFTLSTIHIFFILFSIWGSM
jgi:hypothetical protein